MTPDAVGKAFASARAAQASWANSPVRQRVQPFLRFRREVLTRQAEGIALIRAEMFKDELSAHEEILDAAMVASYYARRAPGLLRARRHPGAFPLLTRTREFRHPRGTVAVITPWNYPLALPIADIVPALIAGNAIVHKPDTQTARTARWARDLRSECGLPAGLWQIVTGEPERIGQSLVDGADYLALTGSTRAGRQIAAAAGQRLIGCSLELGGKNPLIILDDADLPAAAEGAIRACFASSGQLCLSAERILVSTTVRERFLELFVARVAQLDLAPLARPAQTAAVARHIEDALAKGAQIVAAAGGATVLTGVTPAMDVYAQETFGPLVSVYSVETDDDAVRLANDTSYGLNASVWSTNAARAWRLARRLQAGTVNINEGYAAAYASYGAPMGGRKSSGLGSRHGPDGILRFTEPQTVAEQRLLSFDRTRRLGAARHMRLMTAAARVMMALRLR